MTTASWSTPGWDAGDSEVLPVYRGLRRSDPGAFALALKAQTIHAPAEGFFVAQRAFLQSAVESVLRDGFSEPFAATIGALAGSAGRRVVYSPLLEARERHQSTVFARPDSRS